MVVVVGVVKVRVSVVGVVVAVVVGKEVGAPVISMSGIGAVGAWWGPVGSGLVLSLLGQDGNAGGGGWKR